MNKDLVDKGLPTGLGDGPAMGEPGSLKVETSFEEKHFGAHTGLLIQQRLFSFEKSGIV
jgi:hypothetical protein